MNRLRSRNGIMLRRDCVPDTDLICVYLDANVLFSAPYRAESRFLQFWSMVGKAPVTSPYAIGEASRHTRRPDHRARLDALVVKTAIVSDADARYVPDSVVQAAKDRSIPAAAMFASVDGLITGDKSGFGHLYGYRVAGALVLSPMKFLDRHASRLID